MITVPGAASNSLVFHSNTRRLTLAESPAVRVNVTASSDEIAIGSSGTCRPTISSQSASQQRVSGAPACDSPLHVLSNASGTDHALEAGGPSLYPTSPPPGAAT